MKKVSKLLIALSLSAVAMLPAAAQDFQTGYFLGGYNHAFRLNPAFQNERTVLSIGLGDIGIGADSEMGISTFLYPKNGKTYTAFNDHVTSAEFLSNFTGETNPIAGSLSFDIGTLAWWTGRSYITLDARVRSDMDLKVPTDLFRFLKDGATNQKTFDLSSTSFNMNAILEISAGWSHNWNNKFNAGVRIKFLEGITDAHVTFDKLNLTMNDRSWTVDAKGRLDASMEGVPDKLNADGYMDFKEMLKGTDFITAGTSPSGMGGALDLGVSYNPVSWITLSAAVLDLGMIQWYQNIQGFTPTTPYTWSADDHQIDLMDGDSFNDFLDDEKDNLKDALENIYRFQPDEDGKGRMDMLPIRVNAGAEIRLPFYDRLSVGALYSMKHSDDYDWNEFRLSLNWTPIKFLSLSGSTAASNFGKTFGAAINIHPRTLNFFLGADFIPTEVVKIPGADLPLNIGLPRDDLKVNVYLGLSLGIGKTHMDHARKYTWGMVKEVPAEELFPLEEEPAVEEPAKVEAAPAEPETVEEPAVEEVGPVPFVNPETGETVESTPVEETPVEG